MQSASTVLTSVAGSAAIAAAKFVAAAFSGSAAMLTEGVHSAVDTINSLLLYVGLRRSARPPDEQHAFGHGMELYFWTLLVALLIFAVGGGVTIAEGVVRLLRPAPLEHVGWSYAVLGIAAVFNTWTWAVAGRRFLRHKGDRTIWQALRRAKDPTVLTVLFEDTASLIGLALAFLGILLGQLLGLPVLDGVASILIGLLMATVAAGLVYQSKTLLVGETANDEVLDDIRSVVERDDAAREVVDLLTMHFGPHEVLLNLKLRFRDHLSTREIGEAVDRIEKEIRDRRPEVRRIFVEPAPSDGNGSRGERRLARGAAP
jgi:cation diffusion facilitator family transporter